MTTAAQIPPRYLRWILLGSILALIVGIALTPDIRAFLIAAYHALTSDPEATRNFVANLGWAGPLALILAFVLQAVFPVIPALVLIAVTTKAYGPIEGFFIVYIGTLLGAAAGYGLGRWVGDALVGLLAGEKVKKKAHEFAQKYGIQGVLMIRLMPILPADAMNLVAGTAKMGFKPFMLATSAGALPVVALLVWLSGSSQRMVWGLGLFSVVVALSVGVRWWLTHPKTNKQVELAVD